MPSKQYIKGRNKEYTICKRLRDFGFRIAQRTAGSHSPIDVIGIDPVNKKILLIQAKPNDLSEDTKNKLLEENKDLNGEFEVCFIVE